MLEAILSTLKIMGWLGVILGILVLVNISSSAICNIWSGKERFCWKKLIKGVVKAVIFYASATALSIALTMLPYINDMITETCGTVLIAGETLETLSSVGVLGTVVAAIIAQGKKAVTSIMKMTTVSTSEEITWNIEEE